MKPIFALLMCLLLFCNKLRAQFSKDDFIKLNGLTGIWRMPVKNGMLYEKWVVQNDSILTGTSYKITNRDTIPLEKVKLHFNNGMITYIPIAANQNQQQPVDFILIAINDQQYIFENKTHDFPQQITYKLIGTDSLFATINGTTKNGFKEISYPYKRDQKIIQQ